jgi:hypothetical protein
VDSGRSPGLRARGCRAGTPGSESRRDRLRPPAPGCPPGIRARERRCARPASQDGGGETEKDSGRRQVAAAGPPHRAPTTPRAAGSGAPGPDRSDPGP